MHDCNRGISTWTYRGRASRKLVDIRARVAHRILLIICAPIERISFKRARDTARLETADLSKPRHDRQSRKEKGKRAERRARM